MSHVKGITNHKLYTKSTFGTKSIFIDRSCFEVMLFTSGRYNINSTSQINRRWSKKKIMNMMNYHHNIISNLAANQFL